MGVTITMVPVPEKKRQTAYEPISSRLEIGCTGRGMPRSTLVSESLGIVILSV